MSREESTVAAEEVDASVTVVDGRLEMSADSDATVVVGTPQPGPLSKAETHASLRVHGDGFTMNVDLGASQLDGLVDALYHAQGGED